MSGRWFLVPSAQRKKLNWMARWHDKILTRLEKYAGHKVKYDAESISIICENPDSFEVSIFELGDCFQVGFDGWHERFENLDAALDCFAFGLSERCRLKVTMRGRMECAWTVQSNETTGWENDSTTGLLLVPFWRAKRIVLRQNNLPPKA